jgi:hypothetical protein
VKPGPFALVALQLLGQRLAVLPLGGDDGKKPLVENWQRRPHGRKAIVKFAAKFPNANIGVATGLSGVTIVDSDEPELLDTMIRRCGTTPLIIASPRGGAHLWYRFAGEPSGDYLRRHERLNVDVKAAGSLVVVPPSIAWAGPGKGNAYRFLKGSWEDLTSLPECIPGSLPVVERDVAEVHNLRVVRHGFRNNTLLKLLLRKVSYCDSKEDLLDIATTIVDQHFELDRVPPFTSAEIAKIARSAWRMEREDRNWVGTEAKIMIKASEFVVLQRNPDGLCSGDAPLAPQRSPEAVRRFAKGHGQGRGD